MTELANLVNAHPRTGGVGVGVGGVTHDMRPFLQNLAQQRWTSMEEGLSEENDSVSSSRQVLSLYQRIVRFFNVAASLCSDTSLFFLNLLCLVSRTQYYPFQLHLQMLTCIKYPTSNFIVLKVLE